MCMHVLLACMRVCVSVCSCVCECVYVCVCVQANVNVRSLFNLQQIRILKFSPMIL